MDIRLKPEKEEMTRAKVEQGYASRNGGDLLEPDRVCSRRWSKGKCVDCEQCEQNET